MATDNGRKTQVIQLLGGVAAALVLGAVGWSIYSDIHAANLSQSADSSSVTNSSANSANTSATPFDVFDSHKPPLTELSAWAKSWQSGWATSRPSSVAELGNLKSLVENSGLNADNQLSIGTYILGKGDKDVASVWYRSGINQTESEWNAAKKAHPEDTEQDISELVIRPLLARGLDAAEQLFWEPAYLDGNAEYKLTSMELPLARENEWDQRPEWTNIGYGESLFLLNQYTKALAQADTITEDSKTNAHWTDDQKIGIKWLYGLIYYSKHQYKDAIPFLQATAQASSFHHSADAWPLWAIASGLTGDRNTADTIIDDWIRRLRPSAEDVAAVLRVIEHQSFN